MQLFPLKLSLCLCVLLSTHISIATAAPNFDGVFNYKFKTCSKILLDPRTQRQLDSIGASWDVNKINQIRLPLAVAKINDRQTFSDQTASDTTLLKAGPSGKPVTNQKNTTGINVRDLLVRPCGGEFAIPPALNQFREMIEKIEAFELMHNPNTAKYNVYISTSQGVVEAGLGQRRLGAHTDGFQEEDVVYNPDRIIDHTYLAYDAVPTEFFNQEFPVGNRSGQESLLFFDQTARQENIVRADPYTILLMDAFTVHRVAIAEKTQRRTFIKVTFSPEKFNREGNTLNPKLDYTGWTWVPRGKNRNSTSASP